MDYEVTIGIPVYNVKEYIHLTMDSALAQTFDSIEFLICDDCGTDGSMDIIREYQQTHPRGKDIHIVRQPHNMGIGEARNRLMKEAKGRYFYSLDGDDVITSNAISLLYDAAQKYEADIVYGSHERSFVDGDKMHLVQYPYPFRVFTQPDEYADYAYHEWIQVMNWNYLIDINIIRNNHLRVAPVGHGYGEDFTFTVDLPTYVTRVVLLPDITYRYYTVKHVHIGKRTKLMSRVFMDAAIKAIEDKKWRKELHDKPYQAKRCATLMMYAYSFVCQIMTRRGEADPPYTNKEIRDVLKHPMTLWEILSSKESRLKNLFYGFWGVLPPALSVFLLSIFIKLTFVNKYKIKTKNSIKRLKKVY